MTTTTPPKGRPTPKRRVRPWRRALQLVDQLGAAGWGALGDPSYRGVCNVLSALARAVDADKRARQGAPVELATVELTVAELAERAHYSPRWTSACLRVLDAAGVIRWTRGAVIAGKPVPSRFVIMRTRLAELVAEARPGHDETVRQRRAATAARLRELGALFLIPGRSRRRSEHVEVAADQSPYGGGVSTPHPRKSRRTVDEHGLTLDESARLAVRPTNEPAPPAGPDNSGSAGQSFKEQVFRMAKHAPERFAARTRRLDPDDTARARARGVRVVVDP